MERDIRGETSQQPSLDENEAKAIAFFEFIGRPELAELPMTYVKDGVPITIPHGRQFWSHCGHIVGSMMETVIDMDDNNPKKEGYINALKATAMTMADMASAPQQSAHNEQQ